MKFIISSIAASWPGPALAQVVVSEPMMLGFAAATVLAGVWLCWNAPRRRMTLEERVKDGKMDGDAAHRRIRIEGVLGPVVTTVGIGALLLVITR